MWVGGGGCALGGGGGGWDTDYITCRFDDALKMKEPTEGYNTGIHMILQPVRNWKGEQLVLTKILCAGFRRGRANQGSIFFQISAARAVGTTAVIGLKYDILLSLFPVLSVNEDSLENIPKHDVHYSEHTEPVLQVTGTASLFHGKKFMKLTHWTISMSDRQSPSPFCGENFRKQLIRVTSKINITISFLAHCLLMKATLIAPISELENLMF